MPWLQLRIDTTRKAAPELEDALLVLGAQSVTMEDNADEPILEPGLGETPLWSATGASGLFAAETDTNAISGHLNQGFGELSMRWEALEDKDWSRAWMDNYHPIRCGNRLWVCPSWQQPPEPEAVNLMLDPGLAFGTGTHPTTFLCLQWLDQLDCNAKSFIDYGCGSGILGIAALLLGAEKVMGVDIDPQALIATRNNAQTNAIAPDNFPVYLPQQAQLTTADCVLANILAGPLVDLAEPICAAIKPGGLICLSGILATQADTVMTAYQTWIDFDPVEQHEEWVRLTGRKQN